MKIYSFADNLMEGQCIDEGKTYENGDLYWKSNFGCRFGECKDGTIQTSSIFWLYGKFGSQQLLNNLDSK